jgi:hypothetical protein
MQIQGTHTPDAIAGSHAAFCSAEALRTMTSLIQEDGVDDQVSCVEVGAPDLLSCYAGDDRAGLLAAVLVGDSQAGQAHPGHVGDEFRAKLGCLVVGLIVPRERLCGEASQFLTKGLFGLVESEVHDSCPLPFSAS